jgi:hypothetical protein
MLSMMTWWILAGTAGANMPEPEVHVDGEGRVVAVVTVQATPERVRTILADTAGALKELSPNTLSVEVTPDGPCERVNRQTRGIFQPLTLRSKRCPTADGWEETLMESDDFEHYEALWRVRSTESGTEVTYRIATVLTAPVPQLLVRQNLKQAAGTILQGLVARLPHTQ